MKRLISIILCAAALWTACGPVTVNRPSVAGNRKMAMALDRKGRFTFLPESKSRGIYLTDIFGNFLTPLTGISRMCGWSHFSPSNDMVLFVEKVNNEQGEELYHLRVFNLKTEEEELEFISTRFIWFPTWSPNGKYIAFCGEGRDEITVVNWRANEVAHRVPTNSVFYRWLPDATGFLVTDVLDEIDSMQGETLQYFVIRRKYFNTEDETEDLVRGYSRTCWPDISRDGNKVVFNAVEFSGPSTFLVEEIKGKENVYLYDYTTRKVTNLTRDGMNAFSTVISPDAAQVAFVDYQDDALNGGDRWICDLTSSSNKLKKVWTRDDAVYPFWAESGILGFIVLDKEDKIGKGFDNIYIYNLGNSSLVSLRDRLKELYKPADIPEN